MKDQQSQILQENLQTVTPQENSMALTRLLNGIEEASEDIRDKGTRFETLTRDWLTKEPTYRDLFTKVQTYRDWAYEHPEEAESGQDIGVDLVGTNVDDGKFTAIQCKFYKRDARVSKQNVDSFISASSFPWYTRRFLIATNESWTGNIKKILEKTTPAVTLITRTDLENSSVDWSSYAKGKVRTIAKNQLREYQEEAKKNVIKGLESASRGKLIMACGTGKTLTSLRITEELVGKDGFVLFLVPSLSLLSQTLRSWKQQCMFETLHAFAVCSDKATGKADAQNPDSLTSRSELSYPATTDAQSLAEKVKKVVGDGLTVVFSTYQSIEVIHEAQKKYGLPELDLIICDEAHRTASRYGVEEEQSAFTKVHDNDFIASIKRLYMTATPKIYGGDALKEYESGDVVLYSMDDEKVFGKDLYVINFSRAVALRCLVDYKVIVLTVSESLMGDKDDRDELTIGAQGGLSVSNAAKVIGTWRALSKLDLQGEGAIVNDLHPMKRAVGFAQVIGGTNYEKAISKQYASQFENTVEEFKEKVQEEIKQKLESSQLPSIMTPLPSISMGKDGSASDPRLNGDKEPSLSLEDIDFSGAFGNLICDTKHIDGTMDATQKAYLLDWLREEPEKNHCKILFNVRCLSEGVDVPALDAVVFLSPRKSQIDVVQTVGRVMRTSPATNKKRGYVIIPVVTPAGLPADSVLDNNRQFDTVWQILRALKSIDQDFGTIVDGQLGTINPDRMEVIALTTDKLSLKKKSTVDKTDSGERIKTKNGDMPSIGDEVEPRPENLELEFGRDEILEERIRSRIVKRVGNRREWEDWAGNVGEICKKQIENIENVLNNPNDEKSKEAFGEFAKEMRATLNGDLSNEQIVEMLGQHVVIKPILDALFSEYKFMELNPVSRAMTRMVESLDAKGMRNATKLLDEFYQSVKARMKIVKTSAERQTVILELFDKFFKYAFPKMRNKLGIVYTPIHIVDFINQSVAYLLRKEFGTSMEAPGVHVLDPFTGTGTFLTRLMNSGLISKERLIDKFNRDLHGKEIVPLAYYIASMNLESSLHGILPELEYQPNPVMILTDTFEDRRKDELFKTALRENNQLLEKLDSTDIRVIIGNPPYSVGQDSQNDDNANEHYEYLDKRIAETYVANTDSTLKSKLYDSYIRAYRWASDRIGDKGIIGFVTNAGWIEATSADGMRKCMAKEFNSIYIYHLKGNQRTSGERSRKEGGKIFGEGSRAPVAIVLLIKNPEDNTMGKIYFHSVDDFLTREQKLEEIATYKSLENIPWTQIFPDRHGDWLNQRNESFSSFMRMDGKKTTQPAIFKNFSLGIFTSRDAWAYNSSNEALKKHIARSIKAFNSQVAQSLENERDFHLELNPKFLKWDEKQKRALQNGKKAPVYLPDSVRSSIYRPFEKQFLYFDRFWNGRVYQMPVLFPLKSDRNLLICVNQNYQEECGQIALMTDGIPDLHLNGDTQCFPRWIYSNLETNTLPLQSTLALEISTHNTVRKESAITFEALVHFREAYPQEKINDEDLFYFIYGLLHSSREFCLKTVHIHPGR